MDSTAATTLLRLLGNQIYPDILTSSRTSSSSATTSAVQLPTLPSRAVVTIGIGIGSGDGDGDGSISEYQINNPELGHALPGSVQHRPWVAVSERKEDVTPQEDVRTTRPAEPEPQQGHTDDAHECSKYGIKGNSNE